MLQASSVTEALLMSPRSMDSTATKLPPTTSSLCSPTGASSLGNSPDGPFPLGPASMGSSPIGATPLGPQQSDAAAAGASPSCQSSDSAAQVSARPASGSTSHSARQALQFDPNLVNAVVRPDTHHEHPISGQDQHSAGTAATAAAAEAVVAEAVAGEATVATAAAEALAGGKLRLPFKAISLQQLAQAAVDSRKASTPQQLLQQLQASGSNSNRGEPCF